MVPLTEKWRAHMCAVFGPDTEGWLARLPELLAEYERRWSLTLGPPFEPLPYHYVAPGVRADGTDVVLKLGVPHDEFGCQVEALRRYDGQGMVRLLEAEPDCGALLMERLQPGTMLTQVDDERATEIAAEVMRELWRPLPNPQSFPTVAEWAAGIADLRAGFDGGTGPLPRRLVEQAEGLFAELLSSQAEPVLLHGDLHHENILLSERGWLAIDPKGVIGEAAYEIGALLRNPMPRVVEWPDLPRIQSRRVDQFADLLGFDRQRIIGWGIAQAVLSACWSVTDGGDWQPAMAVAEALEHLRP